MDNVKMEDIQILTRRLGDEYPLKICMGVELHYTDED